MGPARDPAPIPDRRPTAAGKAAASIAARRHPRQGSAERRDAILTAALGPSERGLRRRARRRGAALALQGHDLSAPADGRDVPGVDPRRASPVVGAWCRPPTPCRSARRRAIDRAVRAETTHPSQGRDPAGATEGPRFPSRSFTTAVTGAAAAAARCGAPTNAVTWSDALSGFQIIAALMVVAIL